MKKHQYCHACGKQLVYGAKFCSSCGTSLSSLNSTPESTKKEANFIPFFVEGEEDDEDPIDRITKLDIKINKLDYEIVKYKSPVETIGNSMQGIKETDGYKRDTPYANVDPQKFIEDFQKDAGTLRQNEID